MMFKIYIASIAIVLAAAGALYWQNGRLADRLERAEIRAQNAAADLSLVGVASRAQSGHAARNTAIADDLALTERAITQMEDADAPADPGTVAVIRDLGLLAE